MNEGRFTLLKTLSNPLYLTNGMEVHKDVLNKFSELVEKVIEYNSNPNYFKIIFGFLQQKSFDILNLFHIFQNRM